MSLRTPIDEIAARIRAARGYAGLGAKELAPQLGISIETLSRTENGRRTPASDELREIARICGVPLVFMESGWASIAEAVALSDLVSALSDQVTQLERDLSVQRASASEFAAATQRQLDDMQRTMSRLQFRQRP